MYLPALSENFNSPSFINCLYKERNFKVLIFLSCVVESIHFNILFCPRKYNNFFKHIFSLRELNLKGNCFFHVLLKVRKFFCIRFTSLWLFWCSHLLLDYLKARNFRESSFLTFRVDLISRTWREWIFSWFVLQLVVCESQNSCSNFLIFQIALFGYKMLNSQLFDIL